MTGTILWLLELRYIPKNSKTNNTARQLGDGVWWAFITMSTVGYGDIAPKRRFSRFAAVIWMYVALVVPCILTASTSSLVFGLDTFDVEGKTVGVLKNSYESHIAIDVYTTNNVEYSSYQDLMDGVRRGDVFAGLVNADVVTWYQNEKWKDNDGAKDSLAVVDLLPANIDIYWLVSAQIWRHSVTECVSIYKNEQIREDVNCRYYREPQRKDLYVSKFADLISSGELFTYQNVFIIAGVIVLIVGLHMLINRKTIISSNKNYNNNEKARRKNAGTNRNDVVIIKNNNNVETSRLSTPSSTNNYTYKSDFMKELELARITKDSKF